MPVGRSSSGSGGLLNVPPAAVLGRSAFDRSAGGRDARSLAPRLFQMKGHPTDANVQWNRREVSVPTLIYPYRNDVLTGAGDLGSLLIRYSTEPIRAGEGYPEGAIILPAGNLGTCYLWAPGEWWIQVVATGAAGTISLGFVEQPIIDPSVLSYVLYNRPATRPDTFQVTLPLGGADVKVVSVQQLLDGVRAMILDPSNNGDRLSWENPIGASSKWISTTSDGYFEFEGPTLPLSDLWMQNVAGVNHTARVVLFR